MTDDDDDKCQHDIMVFTLRGYYQALARYTHEHDTKLVEIQQKVGALYGAAGPTNFDLLALMGWAMYLLHETGQPYGFTLSVLAEQADALCAAEERKQSGPSS